MNQRIHFLFATLCWLALTPALIARTINWGSDPGSSLFDSNGTPLSSGFIFELGSFGTSFNPDASNMDDWLSNWKTFDRATEPPSNGWNSGAGYFTSSATMQGDGTSSEVSTWSLPSYTFTSTERAFIWVYNSLTQSTTTEWALYTNGFDGNATDDWFFPASSDQTGMPLDWLLADATFTPFGGTNSIQGPGTFTSDPGTFDLQTHVTTVPVPEPSGSLLLGISVLLWLKRTRFRRVR